MEKEEKEGGKKGIMQEKKKVKYKHARTIQIISNMQYEVILLYLPSKIAKKVKTEFCIKIAYIKV